MSKEKDRGWPVAILGLALGAGLIALVISGFVSWVGYHGWLALGRRILAGVMGFVALGAAFSAPTKQSEWKPTGVSDFYAPLPEMTPAKVWESRFYTLAAVMAGLVAVVAWYWDS